MRETSSRPVGRVVARKDAPITYEDEARWRLLITSARTGAENMAIDEAMLGYLAENGGGMPTLRLYSWRPPCLSLGYNQPWKEVDVEACERLGYTWVRRPTGGRAILHTDELTYSIIAPDSDARVAGGILESYRRLSQGLLQGLRLLGADVFQTNGRVAKRAYEGAACFDAPSQYEITVGGRKLVGSAQVRRRKMILQHGSIPLAGDITRICEVLAMPEERRAALRRYLASRACTLESALGRPVTFSEAAQALVEGFRQALNLQFQNGDLNSREVELATALLASRYGTDAWNKRI